MTNSNPKELKIKDRMIREDANGLICLTDIWSAGGYGANQRPFEWWRLPSTKRLSRALLEKLTGKSRSIEKSLAKSIYYTKGLHGTFAHPILACAYAGYLDPKLEIEVRDVWLRYRGGDASLADDILARASPEANQWAGIRAIGRAVRNKYTETLASHGVSGHLDFAKCTNETYIALFDAAAKELKQRKGVTTSLRDAMSVNELSYVMASESLATERIEDMGSQGPAQCQISTRTSARFIREAIEKDRASRQKTVGLSPR